MHATASDVAATPSIVRNELIALPRQDHHLCAMRRQNNARPRESATYWVERLRDKKLLQLVQCPRRRRELAKVPRTVDLLSTTGGLKVSGDARQGGGQHDYNCYRLCVVIDEHGNECAEVDVDGQRFLLTISEVHMWMWPATESWLSSTMYLGEELVDKTRLDELAELLWPVPRGSGHHRAGHQSTSSR